ncbi:MAG: hypothetical protein KDN05_22500, partial [Verrucomicrobiae bacterium]|nr:hypothetical protein [Verrucomicrobiae bacterium]
AFEFNTNGDTEGFAAPPSLNVTGLATSGGYLTGTASSNDPQLKINGTNFTVGAGETWDYIEFRVRETQNEAPSGTVNVFNATGLVVVVNATAPPAVTWSSRFTAVDSGDGFFTVTLDISSLVAVAISDLRVDPIGGAASNSNSETNGNTFEVDYIRLHAVPEPAAALLGGIGLLSLLRRRR